MSFVAIAVGGAAVLGAGVAVYEGSQSRSLASGIAGNQQAMQGVQFGEQQQYAKQLQDLIANPSQVTSLPGYQFMFDQGSQAVQRASAAKGFLNSGNEGTALVQYGQAFATNALTQQEQLLASLSGLQTPVQGNPVGGANAATNATSASNAQLNNLLSQLGLAAGAFGKNIGGSAGSPGNTTGNWSLPGGGSFDGSGGYGGGPTDSGAVTTPGFS